MRGFFHCIEELHDWCGIIFVCDECEAPAKLTYMRTYALMHMRTCVLTHMQALFACLLARYSVRIAPTVIPSMWNLIHGVSQCESKRSMACRALYITMYMYSLIINQANPTRPWNTPPPSLRVSQRRRLSEYGRVGC